MWPFSSGSYITIAKKKQAERDQLIAEAAPSLSTESNEFLKATAQQIVNRIQSGEWSATQVVDAYIARAALSQAETNSITEVLFKEAREQAKELDLKFAQTKTLVGPLHGVPFSVKDQFDIKGYDSTIGFTQWVGNRADKDAHLVALLKSYGAIPIVKTNVPQTMFTFESSNPLWGRTTNPYSKDHACGGSSGGEAAILAMDGAGFGIGSDIGGSLRIPAGYCGIYSLKPSAGRVGTSGARGPSPGFEGLKTVVGPMGRSVADIEMLCRLTFGVQDSRFHEVTPTPFRDVELPKKLKFGYYTSNGFTKPTPAVRRGVLETVDALRKMGHECIEFTPPSVLHVMCLFVGITSSDAYKTMLSHLGPDPRDPGIFLVTFGAQIPGFLRSIAAFIIENILGDPKFAQLLRNARAKPFDEYMQLCEARNKMNEEFYAEVWNKYGFDGIIAPVQVTPAIPNGAATEMSSLATETFYYNLIDSPVGCIPVTRVDRVKDVLTAEWTTGPIDGSSEMEKRLFGGSKPVYDAEKMKGLPVAIQIVGKRWEDEKVLAMMKVVDDALGDRGFGPGAWDAFKASGNGK